MTWATPNLPKLGLHWFQNKNSAWALDSDVAGPTPLPLLILFFVASVVCNLATQCSSTKLTRLSPNRSRDRHDRGDTTTKSHVNNRTGARDRHDGSRRTGRRNPRSDTTIKRSRNPINQESYCRKGISFKRRCQGLCIRVHSPNHGAVCTNPKGR